MITAAKHGQSTHQILDALQVAPTFVTSPHHSDVHTPPQTPMQSPVEKAKTNEEKEKIKAVSKCIKDASRLRQEGKHLAAVRILEEAYSMNPENPNILHSLAAILASANCWEKASEILGEDSPRPSPTKLKP